MAVAITIRNVPDETRDELAARAAACGQSMQEFLLARLNDEAARPTTDQVIARARERAKRLGTRLTAEGILADRDADRC